MIPVVLLGTFLGAANWRSPRDQRNANTSALVCEDTFEYYSLDGSWKVWLSLFPFILVIEGVLGFNLSSRYVAPFTLLITIIVGLMYFTDDGWAEGRSIIEVSGLVLLTVVERVIWTVFEYAFNVFAAFMFLRVVQLWGIVDSMRVEFEELANSPARKVLLILFCFAVMVAVVAPGGSNFLIAGAIIIEMNIQNLEDGKEKNKYDMRIGAICLFGNAITSAFNLVGVCVIAMADDVAQLAADNGVSRPCADLDLACIQRQIAYNFSAQFFLFSLFTPLVMMWLYLREKVWTMDFFKKEVPLALLCGLTYAAVRVWS